MNPFSTDSQLKYHSYAKQLRGLYQKPIAQTSTALILTLAAAAFFGLAAIKPTLATVSELMRELEDKKEIEAQLINKINSLAAVQEEYLLNKDSIGLLELAIPGTHNLKLLVLQLEYLCWQHQIPIKSMRIEPLTIYPHNIISAKPTETYPSFIINMNVLSDQKANFFNLLDSITSLDRIIRLEKVSFSDTDTEEETQPSMSITLRVYWAPTQPQIESLDSSNTN